MSSSDPPDAAHRAAVRRVATGVAVLTVELASTPHGVTVSSLTAVSRDPLLVGFCLHRSSSCLEIVKSCRGFAVSVLNATQTTTARWFADPCRPRGRAQFDGFGWQPDPVSGAPVLADSLAWISCRPVANIDAGDHELLLAEVVGGSTRDDGQPLLSFAGQIHEANLRAVPARATTR
ncbi:flavin reductase family protein [Salinispora mooreana]|uniref:flavin reductase family protein n=1 Tax=Salinispora mooreana TaxID=999545 RepID=UPI000365630B|nr:flavin reductase family protein [Salinispora mooreana]